MNNYEFRQGINFIIKNTASLGAEIPFYGLNTEIECVSFSGNRIKNSFDESLSHGITKRKYSFGVISY